MVPVSHCRICRAEVIEAQNQSGDQILLDLLPVPDRVYHLTEGKTVTEQGRLIGPAAAIRAVVYRPHECPARQNSESEQIFYDRSTKMRGGVEARPVYDPQPGGPPPDKPAAPPENPSNRGR